MIIRICVLEIEQGGIMEKCNQVFIGLPYSKTSLSR